MKNYNSLIINHLSLINWKSKSSQVLIYMYFNGSSPSCFIIKVADCTTRDTYWRYTILVKVVMFWCPYNALLALGQSEICDHKTAAILDNLKDYQLLLQVCVLNWSSSAPTWSRSWHSGEVKGNSEKWPNNHNNHSHRTGTTLGTTTAHTSDTFISDAFRKAREAYLIEQTRRKLILCIVFHFYLVINNY